jgi:putative ABC transport system substrate-binding protein
MIGTPIQRRSFLTLLGGAAAAWPLAARAQQARMPVIGFLNAGTPETSVDRIRAFHQGLKEAGYVEGDNVTILYRWAEDQVERLPALAADLTQRQVAVIATFGTAPALTAKAATTKIPIIFAVSEDPVRLGLVASLARPGGNLTGFNFLGNELVAKRLELLRAMVPSAVKIAVLANPAIPASEPMLRDPEAAAETLGLRLQVLNVSNSREINAAFASFVRERPDALFVGAGFLFFSRRVQLVHLASRHAVPASYQGREWVEVGGLMSYGADLTGAYRHIGAYAGRILRGAKPPDLPVVQSSKFELVINAETARLLDLSVLPTLLTIADEVIE